MAIRDLLDDWERSAAEPRPPRRYGVRLSLDDAARLAALNELYPGRDEEDLITDLLSEALRELEAAFPYVPGEKLRDDDHGDPVYADAGLTPRFQALAQQHLERLRRELGN